MLLVRPIALTPGMVTASNAGSADADYSAATSYTLGQRVYLPDDGRTYECVQAPALAKYPATSPLYWMRAEPSNRWAMFDSEVSTASKVSGNLTATLTVPGRINSVTLHGLVGNSLTVVQKSAAGDVLFTATRALKSSPGGWYAYYYEERTQLREAWFTGLIPLLGSRIEITVTGSATACGYVLAGNSIDIGDAQYGFSTGIVDYSKTTVTNGVQTFEKGRYSKRMMGTLMLKAGRYNTVHSVLENYRQTPCAWIGIPDSADFEPMTILGVYRDFSIELAGPTHHICSLEVLSLT